jgi:uncharacterized DUF497 family protein
MTEILISILVWDSWNIDHIAQHGVVPEEVEAVCFGRHIVRQSYNGRFLVIGYTEKLRPLAIILAPKPEEGAFYPVTARTADRKERRIYHEETEGGEAA